MNELQTVTYERDFTSTDFNRLPTSLRIPAAECKYAEAVAMYAATNLTIRCVAEKCGVTAAGLSAHIRRHHRDLLFARYNLNINDPNLRTLKVKPPQGQSLATHIKYKEAVEACGDLAYIEFNVSQIARLFNLDGPALAAQLRVHYPDIIPTRERLRQRLGIADNTHRGPRSWSIETYASAIEMYRDTDLTISEVAEKCNVSRAGLCQFLRFYHKDIIASKSARRKAAAKEAKVRKSQMPVKRRFRKSAAAKYGAAIESLKKDPRPVAEVAAAFGLNPEVFREYLKIHEPQLAAQQGMMQQPNGKIVRRSSAEKYAQAILEYASTSESLKSIAQRHGIVYNSIRAYIQRNCPEQRASHQRNPK